MYVRVCVFRGLHEQDKMADLMASAASAVLHYPKLCQTSLGEVLHAVLHPLDCLDRSLLLLYGVDGKCGIDAFSISSFIIVPCFVDLLAYVLF